MATNPMQKKARNSFFLGMLVTLIVTGVVIALLLMQLINIKKEQEVIEQSYVNVLTLNRDVKSGEEITSEDLIPTQTTKDVAPTNPISIASLGEKNIAKINLTKGTVVSADMLYIDATAMGDDVRRQEYNTIILPMDLMTGDYIDVRLMMPSGQDFIVVSKKQVEIPMIGGVDSTDTIWIELSEDEILTMSNAIVDAYMVKGSKLYATKYTEAGNQTAATPTYAVSSEVGTLIENNPNIVEQALNELRARYNRTLRENYINSAISGQTDAKSNEETEMQESIINSHTSREQYLQSLNAGIITQ